MGAIQSPSSSSSHSSGFSASAAYILSIRPNETRTNYGYTYQDQGWSQAHHPTSLRAWQHQRQESHRELPRPSPRADIAVIKPMHTRMDVKPTFLASGSGIFLVSTQSSGFLSSASSISLAGLKVGVKSSRRLPVLWLSPLKRTSYVELGLEMAAWLI